MLPLSQPAYEFLNYIFSSHGNISVTFLREQFLRIDSFYMSKGELKKAEPTARLVASDWEADTPIDDIEEEDIMEPVDEEELFEDKVKEVKVHQKPAADFESLKTLSPLSPNSDVSSNSSPTIPNAEQVNDPASPNYAKTIAEQLYRQVEEDAVEGRSVPRLSISSSSASSDFVVTPESHAVDPVEVVPDLPSDVMGDKLLSIRPVTNKQNPVKSVVARGGKFLSKVRMVL